MSRLIAVAILVVALTGGRTFDQQATRNAPPDLSGSWVLETSSSLPPWPFAREMTVTQDATQATVSSPGTSMTFRFDGTETEQTTRTVLGVPWRRAARVTWAGYALVVVMRVDAGSMGAWEDLAVCSLDSERRLQLSTFETQKSTERGVSVTHFLFRRR